MTTVACLAISIATPATVNAAGKLRKMTKAECAYGQRILPVMASMMLRRRPTVEMAEYGDNLVYPEASAAAIRHASRYRREVLRDSAYELAEDFSRKCLNGKLLADTIYSESYIRAYIAKERAVERN